MKDRRKVEKLKATVLLTLLLNTGYACPKASADNSEFNVQIVDNPVFASYLCDILENLPEGIQKYLKMNNLNVVLLENEYGADGMWQYLYGDYFGSIRGFTYVDTYQTTIYVESSYHPGYYETYATASNGYSMDEFNYILARVTLLHELGHFFDSQVDFTLSGSYEFNQIFWTELNNYLNTTQYKVANLGIYANVSSPVEYFATAYSCYIAYNEELKENCPLTYDYINNYMNKLNEEYTSVSDKTLIKK